MDKRMMNPYYYLYYRLYIFSKKIGTKDATWTAMLLVTTLVGLNLFTILFAVLGKEKVFFLSPKIIGGFVAILIGIINYFIFIYKDRCNNIIAGHAKEGKTERIWSSIFTIVYILITWYLAHKN